MKIFNYKLGIITGFIFGLISPYLIALGLVSLTFELIQPITSALFFPVIYLFTFLPFSFTLAVFLNGILYAFIGFLIQFFLRKHHKKEFIVLIIYIAIVLSFIVVLFIDGLLGRTGA